MTVAVFAIISTHRGTGRGNRGVRLLRHRARQAAISSQQLVIRSASGPGDGKVVARGGQECSPADDPADKVPWWHSQSLNHRLLRRLAQYRNPPAALRGQRQEVIFIFQQDD